MSNGQLRWHFWVNVDDGNIDQQISQPVNLSDHIVLKQRGDFVNINRVCKIKAPEGECLWRPCPEYKIKKSRRKWLIDSRLASAGKTDEMANMTDDVPMLYRRLRESGERGGVVVYSAQQGVVEVWLRRRCRSFLGGHLLLYLSL